MQWRKINLLIYLSFLSNSCVFLASNSSKEILMEANRTTAPKWTYQEEGKIVQRKNYIQFVMKKKNAKSLKLGIIQLEEQIKLSFERLLYLRGMPLAEVISKIKAYSEKHSLVSDIYYQKMKSSYSGEEFYDIEMLILLPETFLLR